MDAGSVLGVPAVRPALLDDLPAACAAEAETRGTDNMTAPHEHPDPPPAWCDDDVDDELDDDEFDDDDDEDADDEDEDDDVDEPETWQVHAGICGVNCRPFA